MDRWIDSAVINKQKQILEAVSSPLTFSLFLPILLTLLFQVNAGSFVSRLIEIDGRIYASVINQTQSDSSTQTALLVQYDPAPQTWTNTGELWQTFTGSEPEPLPLPITQCLDGNSAICYRIEGDEQILESDDGGQSWQTSWKVPAGRRLFMNRAAFLEGGRVDIGPYDLLVTGSGDNHQVFVAAGTEGFLMRGTDGEWQRQGILSARPTPYRAASLLEILVTIPAELGGWLLFVLIYGVGQYLFFLKRLRHIFPPIITAFLIFMTGGLILAYRVLNTGQLSEWGIFLLVCVMYCAPIYLAYRKWVGETYKMDNEEKGKEAAWFWMWSTIGLFFGGILLLALWPIGLIPFYLLMVLLVLALALGIAWWGSNRIQTLMQEAGW